MLQGSLLRESRSLSSRASSWLFSPFLKGAALIQVPTFFIFTLCGTLFMRFPLPRALQILLSYEQHAPPPGNEMATATTSLSFSSLTGCHLHGSTQFCLASATEYQIVPEETGTASLPSSYTGCHAHGDDVFCFPPTGNGEVLVIGVSETAPSPTPTSGHSHDDHDEDHDDDHDHADVTAVTSCHMHESSLVCDADSTEYYVQTTVTATTELPAQFTGCHAHDTDIYCLADGDEVLILPVDDVESGDADPEEKHCHFHAGVEHCVGGSEEEVSCERVDRDYDIPIRIGLLFVVLVASAIGVFGPILTAAFTKFKFNILLLTLKQFGTGVIISTAFVHLYTHASLMFGNSCLGELEYEATTSAIVMAGMLISFLIEYIARRALLWRSSKKAESAELYLTPEAIAKAELTNISIMEAGIIFHSLLIGLTLIVAGDSVFVTLAIVIVFHQMFEGIALGTRIAALGCGTATRVTPLGHSHSHGIDEASSSEEHVQSASISLSKKLCLAAMFAVITPIGMAIGLGVIHKFNGNDPSTIVAIGTLDALSAGILIWIGLVEMWAHDWILGGELTNANVLKTSLGMFGLIAGMVLMSFLGKWA